MLAAPAALIGVKQALAPRATSIAYLYTMDNIPVMYPALRSNIWAPPRSLTEQMLLNAFESMTIDARRQRLRGPRWISPLGPIS